MVDKRPITGIFHEKEDMVFVVKVPVQLDHIGMRNRIVQSQLHCQLSLHAVLVDSRL